ncbi:hypothetical protein FRC01_009572, partial [Tulasnella sp. 417]
RPVYQSIRRARDKREQVGLYTEYRIEEVDQYTKPAGYCRTVQLGGSQDLYKKHVPPDEASRRALERL